MDHDPFLHRILVDGTWIDCELHEEGGDDDPQAGSNAGLGDDALSNRRGEREQRSAPLLPHDRVAGGFTPRI